MEEEMIAGIILSAVGVSLTLICLYTIYCGLKYGSIKIEHQYGYSRKIRKEEPMMFWFYFGVYIFFTIIFAGTTIPLIYSMFF